MGVDVNTDQFSPADYDSFGARLQQCLQALEQLLSRDDFGAGPLSLGAEIEMFLVDGDGQPSLTSERVLQSLADPSFTVEIDRFNIECNTAPCRLAGTPFRSLKLELERRFAQLSAATQEHGVRALMVGILPTLMKHHFEREAMTDVARYRAMSRVLRARREEPFQLHIDGIEPLQVSHEHVTLEGGTTSLQLHLRVPPAEFTRVYNAAQLVTAPALAACGNSPLLLGHQLWDETRIALFKQSVDERRATERITHRQPRVSFGTNWLNRGALELFEENVQQFDPILPVVASEAPLEKMQQGHLPSLSELRLHSGTIWRWNRPVYDPAEGGHLRIEMRAIPAGPTITDMVANAAFLIGATLGVARQEPSAPGRLPFNLAQDNFYRAAQHGLDAQLNWPTPDGVARQPATNVARELLPLARKGLRDAGVAADDIDVWLQTFEARLASGQTGARWQRARLQELGVSNTRNQALAKLVQEYIEHSERGTPVHEWPR